MRIHTMHWIAIVSIVALAGFGLALPAAADLDLIGGGRAQVADTAGDGVNVREAPDAGAAIVAGLPESFAVMIDDGPLAVEDGSFWYAVTAELEDGSVFGWVSADYLRGMSAVVEPPPDDESAASGVPVYLNSDGSWLNLRSGPSVAADVMTAIPDGAPVEVLEPVQLDEEGVAWSMVRYDGVVGYSAAAYLGGFSTANANMDDGLLTVGGTGGDGLSLRESPDAAAGRLTTLSEGTQAWLLDGPVSDAAGDTWYQIEADGLVGWSNGGYLSAAGSGASATGAAIVDAALGYLGVPYVWAGTTPDGFDCSGFTWFIVSNVADSDFPRPDEDQVVYGSEIAAGDLAPGDLIFFRNTYQWGLSHVGIYLGDGQFISASGEHDAVGISSLSDPYWSTRYLTARRVT
ncbi:MAG: C40 family peptidase [Chloroflexota bacterium]|nr:C40 family peptidase [Chloroflexota bacterium]